MRYIYFLALLWPLQNICFAQNVDVISELEENIAQSELNACSKKIRPTACNAIPGTLLTTVLSDQLTKKKTDNSCSETAETKKKKKKKKDDKKEVSDEVLLIAELHTQDSTSNIIQNSKAVYLQNTTTKAGLSSIELIENILNIPDGFKGTPPPSDDMIAEQAAKMISDHTTTEQEKINLLGELSKRLYKNYNDKRNPTKNTEREDIPKEAISLLDMFNAASENNKDKGGVCNDISLSVAQVAQKVFPKKDVLVINNGTHFGVMLHEKDTKGALIEGGGTLVANISDPMMDARFPVPTSRIYKFDGHILKQIAVADTEMGVALKKAIGAQTDAVSTGVDPSLILANYRREVQKNGKLKTYELKTGAAETSNANLLIIVAQNSRETKKSQSTLALSTISQDIKATDQKNVIIALHAGLQRTLIQYQSPRLLIKATAGAEADVSYAFQSQPDPASPLDGIMPIAATLQLNQKVDFATRPANLNNPSFNGRFQVAQDFGSTNEGARQGTLTDPGVFRAVWGSMKYMGFNLNQAMGNVNMNIPIDPKLTSFTQLRYQGTNIYQDFTIMSGFELVSDGGQLLMAYLGYRDTTQGYKTSSSLVTRPSGVIAGAGVTTKGGVEINTNLLISPNANNSVQKNISIKKTFGGKKKKKKK